MLRILIAAPDIPPCDWVPDAARWPETRLVRTASALVGAFHARQGRFDLAIIDAELPRWSGLLIAEFAARNGTPALLLCGRPGSGRLEVCNYPYLSQPFSRDAFWDAARDEIARGEDNVGQVLAAAARLAASGQSVAEFMAVARRLLAGSQPVTAVAPPVSITCLLGQDFR